MLEANGCLLEVTGMEEHDVASYSVATAASGGSGDYGSLRRKAHNAFGFMRERRAELEYPSGVGGSSTMSAEERKTKVEQNCQFILFEKTARKVLQRIGSEEALLSRACPPPHNKPDADQMIDYLKQRWPELQEMYESACGLVTKAEEMKASGHSEAAAVLSLSESVSTRWRCLEGLAEERFKLCMSARAWFERAHAVCTLLERCAIEFEQGFEREGTCLYAASSFESATPGEWDELHGAVVPELLLQGQIADHAAHKENLLKATNDARCAAQTYVKYLRRYMQQTNSWGSDTVQRAEDCVKDILDKTHKHEMEVLKKWAKKKASLDSLLSDLLASLQSDGSHGTADDAQLLSRKSIVSMGSSSGRGSWPSSQHEDSEWMLEATVVTPTSRPLVWKESRVSLEAAASAVESLAVQDMLEADYSAVEEAIGHMAGLTAGKNKQKPLKRREEYVMAELLQTERAYVEDLKLCLQYYLREMKNGITPVPVKLDNKHSIIFGNLEEIANFHETVFLPELQQYEAMPGVVGHCFVTWAEKFSMYVSYCENKPASTELLVEHGGEEYFAVIQKKYPFLELIDSYLIKPVQRITKYQLLLKDLMSCCDRGKGELNSTEAYGSFFNLLNEGLDVMLNVPKSANDNMHLRMLRGVENETLASYGDLLLQDKFVVTEGKRSITNKSRNRQLFLFENYLLFAKEHTESAKTSYTVKSVVPISELAVSEYIGGDDCKLGLWTSAMSPAHRKRLVLKGRSASVKALWSNTIGKILNSRLLRLDGVEKSSPSNDSVFTEWSPSPLEPTATPSEEQQLAGGSPWARAKTIMRRNTISSGKCNGLRSPAGSTSSIGSTPRNSRCSNGSLSSGELPL